jgi:hypothetical protein
MHLRGLYKLECHDSVSVVATPTLVVDYGRYHLDVVMESLMQFLVNVVVAIHRMCRLIREQIVGHIVHASTIRAGDVMRMYTT